MLKDPGSIQFWWDARLRWLMYVLEHFFVRVRPLGGDLLNHFKIKFCPRTTGQLYVNNAIKHQKVGTPWMSMFIGLLILIHHSRRSAGYERNLRSAVKLHLCLIWVWCSFNCSSDVSRATPYGWVSSVEMKLRVVGTKLKSKSKKAKWNANDVWNDRRVSPFLEMLRAILTSSCHPGAIHRGNKIDSESHCSFKLLLDNYPIELRIESLSEKKESRMAKHNRNSE